MEKNYQYVSPKAKSILLHYESPLLESSDPEAVIGGNGDKVDDE